MAENLAFVHPDRSEVSPGVACCSGSFALALARRVRTMRELDLTLEMLGEARKEK